MRKSGLWICAVLALWAMACDGTGVYEESYTFEGKTWHLDSIPSFEFEIEDRQTKDIYITLRNSISYPNQNLYMTFFLEDSTGNQLETSLVNLDLFDIKTGKPFGSGNSIFQHRLKVLSDYTFPTSGIYRFRVAQYMREISLPEVHSVGLRVEESEN